MATGVCDGCGQDGHLALTLDTDEPVTGFIGDRQYCQTCGSFLAGYLEYVQRTVFKREVKRGAARD